MPLNSTSMILDRNPIIMGWSINTERNRKNTPRRIKYKFSDKKIVIIENIKNEVENLDIVIKLNLVSSFLFNNVPNTATIPTMLNQPNSLPDSEYGCDPKRYVSVEVIPI